MKKILCINEEMGKDPSFRFRALPFIPYLNSAGFEVDMIEGVPAQSFADTKYDAIWIRRQIIPKQILETLQKICPIIYDFDDSLFLRTGFRDVVSASADVLCGSKTLSYYALLGGAKSTSLLRTGVDVVSYPISSRSERMMVWTGSWSTIPHLLHIRDDLIRLNEAGIKLRVVCDNKPKLPFDFDFIPWTPKTEKIALSGATVGIAPLPANLSTVGKCALKVVQYMAAGLPVVASSVGANKEIFTDLGCHGIHLQNKDSFHDAVLSVLDSQTCDKMAETNRDIAMKFFDISILAETLIDTFQQVT
jgi:glycosyltransferase involved in cell wall biosynthesis